MPVPLTLSEAFNQHHSFNKKTQEQLQLQHQYQKQNHSKQRHYNNRSHSNKNYDLQQPQYQFVRKSVSLNSLRSADSHSGHNSSTNSSPTGFDNSWKNHAINKELPPLPGPVPGSPITPVRILTPKTADYIRTDYRSLYHTPRLSNSHSIISTKSEPAQYSHSLKISFENFEIPVSRANFHTSHPAHQRTSDYSDHIVLRKTKSSYANILGSTPVDSSPTLSSFEISKSDSLRSYTPDSSTRVDRSEVPKLANEYDQDRLLNGRSRFLSYFYYILLKF